MFVYDSENTSLAGSVTPQSSDFGIKEVTLLLLL